MSTATVIHIRQTKKIFGILLISQKTITMNQPMNKYIATTSYEESYKSQLTIE